MVELSPIFQQELKLILKKFSINLTAENLVKVQSLPKEKKVIPYNFSGTFEGKSTGTPIGFVIYNENQNRKITNILPLPSRPSHADFMYDQNLESRLQRWWKIFARETIN